MRYWGDFTFHLCGIMVKLLCFYVIKCGNVLSYTIQDNQSEDR